MKKEMAEKGGFEPPVRCYPYNGLANRRLQPLGHLSTRASAQGQGAAPVRDIMAYSGISSQAIRERKSVFTAKFSVPAGVPLPADYRSL